MTVSKSDICRGKKLRKMPGKCSFQDAWMRESAYKGWIRKLMHNKHAALCAFCGVEMKLSSMGESVLRQHLKSERHKKMEAKNNASARCNLTDFFSAASSSATSNPSPSTSGSTASAASALSSSTVGASDQNHLRQARILS